MDRHVIFGVHLTDRLHHAGMVQQLLTQYGEHIRTRLGLHAAHGHRGGPNGLILLEMLGDDPTLDVIQGQLEALDGVEVQRMVFHHPAS